MSGILGGRMAQGRDRTGPWRAAWATIAPTFVVAAAFASCATMDSLTKRTADSPAQPWVPPAGETRPPEPLTPPSIPPELQAAGLRWTLADIVDVGLSNNPASRAAWNTARAASAGLVMSKAGYVPLIEVTVTGAKQKSVFAGGQFVIDQTILSPSASLSLLLFDFGGREASVRAARRTLEAANWTQNAVLQNVILQIEGAYYQYLAARAMLVAQEASREGAQANYDAADLRHRAGVATIADVLQSKTALSAVELEIVSTRGLIQTLHGALASAMGLPVTTPFEVAEELPETIPFECVDRQVEQCVKDAAVRRPDLAAARAQVLAAEAGVRKARSTFFPAFSLGGDVGRIYYQGRVISNPFYALSVTVVWPFSFGLQAYDVLAAKAEAEAARDRTNELGRGIELQVWTSYYGIKTAAQRVASSGDLVASAQASYDVALGRYKEGVGSILDLLAAQSVLENARVQLIQAKSDWFQALVQFTHDTGVLGPPPVAPKTVPSTVQVKGDHRP